MEKVLLWTISTYCNLNCRYCYYTAEERRNKSLKNLLGAYEQIFQLNPSVIYISGEPSLLSNLKDIVCELKTRLPNCKLILTTNAVSLSKEKILDVVDYITMFLISLDGPNEELHNLYRSDFSKVIRTIDLINELRNDRLLLGITSVVHRYNLAMIEESCHFFIANHVDYMHFQPLYMENGADLGSLNNQQLLDMHEKISLLKKQYIDINFSSDEYLNALKNYSLTGNFGMKCHNGEEALFLSETGELKNCPSPFVDSCEQTLNCINMIELANIMSVLR